MGVGRGREQCSGVECFWAGFCSQKGEEDVGRAGRLGLELGHTGTGTGTGTGFAGMGVQGVGRVEGGNQVATARFFWCLGGAWCFRGVGVAPLVIELCKRRQPPIPALLGGGGLECDRTDRLHFS